MANIKEILKRFDIEADKVELITDSINKEYIGEEFVAKKQYHKRVKENDDLKEKVVDLEAKSTNPATDEWKGKYEALEKEHNDFKTNIETEKVNGGKVSLLKKQLKDLNVDEKMIKLLVKEFDLSKIELENDTIKDWETHKELVKDYIPVVETSGIVPTTPPRNTDGSGETGPKSLSEALHQKYNI